MEVIETLAELFIGDDPIRFLYGIAIVILAILYMSQRGKTSKDTSQADALKTLATLLRSMTKTFEGIGDGQEQIAENIALSFRDIIPSLNKLNVNTQILTGLIEGIAPGIAAEIDDGVAEVNIMTDKIAERVHGETRNAVNTHVDLRTGELKERLDTIKELLGEMSTRVASIEGLLMSRNEGMNHANS